METNSTFATVRGSIEPVPGDLRMLLDELRRRRWTLVRWGRAELPELLAATYAHLGSGYVDVLLLRAREDSTGYRVRAEDSRGVFNPSAVVWQYHASAVWTFRATLGLTTPSEPGAPTRDEEPSGLCRLPEGLPQPVVIRPL